LFAKEFYITNFLHKAVYLVLMQQKYYLQVVVAYIFDKYSFKSSKNLFNTTTALRCIRSSEYVLITKTAFLMLLTQLSITNSAVVLTLLFSTIFIIIM